jgi:outer membrane protein, heavy metal efflux system
MSFHFRSARAGAPGKHRGVALAFVLTLAPVPLAVAQSSPAASAVEHASARELLQDPHRLAAWLGTHSAQLAAARARVAQATADFGTSRLLPNPVLDGTFSNLSITKTNPPGLPLDQTAIYGVGISETVELGKRGPRSGAAALRAESARLGLEATWAERVATAREALGLAVHLGVRLAILGESLSAAEHAAGLERTRFEQKALSGMDYDRLLLDLAALRSDFARNQAEYDSALAACAAVMGAECSVAGATEEDLAAAVPLTAEAGDSARLGQRPDVRALEVEGKAAEKDAQLARARAIPDLTFRLGYTHDRFTVSGDNRNTLGLSVALPLPLFDRGQYEAQKGRSHALELAQSRTATLAEARADLATLLNRKAALEKNLDILERDTLPRSRSVLDSAERAFTIGGASLTDLLLSRRTHIALELTRLDQRFELFSLRSDLYRLLTLDSATKGTL